MQLTTSSPMVILMTEDQASAKKLIHAEREEAKMTFAVVLLSKKKWRVYFSNDDPEVLTVISPKGRMYYYWPFDGTYSGRKRGQGLREMIKDGEE
jgi:hypothetical protein